MYRTLLSIITLFLCLVISNAQVKEIKKGPNYGPLPIIDYSVDKGFQFGGKVDMYHYGDGSLYPDYLYSASLSASAYTKGDRAFKALFDSKHLIPGGRYSMGILYSSNAIYPFYGFNGAAAPYDPSLSGILDDGTAFYKMHRSLFRILTSYQRQLGDTPWGWAAGMTWVDARVGTADNWKVKNDYSLYGEYVAKGIIPAEEADGGKHLEMKAGISYDSRDNENSPSRGTSFELFTYGSCGFVKGTSSYLRLAVKLKQFVPLYGEDLILAYHLAYQGTIAGHTPFYLLPIIQSINLKQYNAEGLGGTRSLRRVMRNRVQGDGYAWTNVELRWTFARFRLANQNWRLLTNPFVDAGAVVQPYRLDAQKAVGKGLLYSGEKETIHGSVGIGLHLLMNRNINVGIEYAHCFRDQDGQSGFVIGSGFLF